MGKPLSRRVPEGENLLLASPLSERNKLYELRSRSVCLRLIASELNVTEDTITITEDVTVVIQHQDEQL